MSHLLTIIMPCFNSEKTLEQAVNSIFQQEIKIPFEVILVDDASEDETPRIMKKLSTKHKRIKCFFHTRNLGGGAARNTAVEKSTGDLIFCLDSDDLLGDNMLQPMVEQLIDQKLDGVGVHISKKFNGNNLNKIAYINEFGYVGQIIPFESLFDKSTCALNSTFLHTREAFHTCGGYPTDHGFDTQSFAFRFLSNGLKASVCKGATYLHRVNFHRSYFIREYEAGKMSENFMKIYEEFFFLFSERVQKKLLEADLKECDISPHALSIYGKKLLKPNHKKLIRNHVKKKYEDKLLKMKKVSAYDNYWLGCIQLERKEYYKALLTFSDVMNKGIRTDRVKQKIMEAITGITHLSSQELMSLSTNKESHKRKLKLSLLKKRNDVARIVRKFI